MIIVTVEFRLDMFCTKASYNAYKQRIRDSLTVYNEVALAEYLLQLQPKLSILETLENVCEDIVESNNWYDSSCQRYTVIVYLCFNRKLKIKDFQFPVKT